MEVELGPTFSEETEAGLKAQLAFMRDQRDDARAGEQLWKTNYEAAVKILAAVAPPDFTEAFEDRAFKEYLSA